MHDNPTLLEVFQFSEAWLRVQYQTFMAWLSSLGDLHVDTLVPVIGIGASVVFIVILFACLVTVWKLAVPYHALGHPWIRALRLAHGDFDGHHLSWLAATPAERQAWSQDLEHQRCLP